jgi:hypothetical protein
MILEIGLWEDKLEPTIGRVFTLWIHSLKLDVAFIVERYGVAMILWLGGTSLFYNQLLENSRQISVPKCICELC